MTIEKRCLTAAIACVCAVGASTQVWADSTDPRYVQFSPSATKGAYYQADADLFPDAHVGVVVMHRSSNFLSHISTTELRERGFNVLAMNPRCDNNEAACAPWENNALDLAQGVEFLRSQPGISHVVLLGHSGGGPTMSFYQAVAENGASFCQAEAKLMKCGEGFDDLPKADALILMDAHAGNTTVALRGMNPAVLNYPEIFGSNAAPEIDPALDGFAAANGFESEGSSYSPDFLEAYYQAQSRQMDTLIDLALARLQYAEENGLGDAPFVIPMGVGARLMLSDTTIQDTTLAPQKLLLNDGTIISDHPVSTVRVATLQPVPDEHFSRTMFLTAKSFLSTSAIRSTDSMENIDWCSSNNSTPCNLESVSVPLLITAMSGHYFIRDGEVSFDHAASADKDYVIIEGANHSGGVCTACESEPGQYSNATRNLFDLMADWMNDRF